MKASRGATIWRDFIAISGTRRFKVVKKRKTYVVRRKARKSGRGDSATPPLQSERWRRAQVAPRKNEKNKNATHQVPRVPDCLW